MSFTGWGIDILPGTDKRRSKEIEKSGTDAQAREAGRTDSTYWGTNEPIKDDHDVTEKKAGAGTTEKKEESGWSFLSDTWKRVSGQTTTGAANDGKDNGKTIATTTSSSSTTITPSGTLTDTTDHGSVSVKGIDVKAMAATVKGQLEKQRDEPGTSDQDRAKLDAQIAKLAAPTLDEAALKQIVVDQKLQIRPQYKDSFATTNTTTTKADALAGTLSSTDVNSKTTTNADGTLQNKGTTSTANVTAGQGAATVSQTKATTDMKTDAQGNALDGGRNTSSASGSLLGGANGHGAAAAQNKEDATTKTENGTTTNTKNSNNSRLALTDKGAAATVGSQNSTLKNDTQLRQSKSSADGSFTIDIAAIPGSAPPQFQVVFTIAAGLAAEAKRAQIRSEKLAATPGTVANTASATGNLSFGAALVFTHVMDEAAAKEYMKNADKVEAGAAKGETVAPEFGVYGKVKAMAQSGGVAMGGIAALGGSESAKMLKDGESVDMTLSADVRAGVAGGRGNAETGDAAKSVSVDASAGGGLSRKVHIARSGVLDAKGHHMVDVTVTFMEKHDWKLGASGSAEGASANLSHAEGGSTSNGATVRLDCDAPDYEDKFHKVTLATSVDEVRAMATQLQKTVTDSQTTAGGVSAAGVGVQLGNKQDGVDSTNVDKGDKRVLGTQAGSNQDQSGMTVGSGDKQIKPLQDNTTNSTTTTVDKKGVEVDIDKKEEKSDFTKSVSDGASSAWSSVKGLFSSDKSQEKKASDIADLATSSPQEKLKAQVETTYADLNRYQLFESDIETIVQRAGDAKSWTSCNSAGGYIGAWEAFRLSLRMPPIKADEAEVNKVDAHRLALGRVMADNMKTGGGRAMSAIDVVLRHWKTWQGEDNKALGVHWEWPESMKATRAKYEFLHQRSRNVDDNLAGMSGKPDSLSRATAWKNDTLKQFDEVKWAVRDSADVTPNAKAEMFDQLMKERAEVDEAFERHQKALESGKVDTAGTKDAKADAASGMDRAGKDPATDPSQQTSEQQSKHMWKRVTDITELLGVYKLQERNAYARARALLPKTEGGTVDTSSALAGTYRAFFQTNWNQAQNILSELGHETHKSWIERIKELRSVYAELKLEPEKWIVSQPGQVPRRSETEPDIKPLQELISHRHDNMDLSFSARLEESQTYQQRWNTY